MNKKMFKSGYVALIGRPNAGKSTLTNAIVGETLSIVTKKPQTTRHRICGILTDEEAQIILIDTPGYHRSQKPLNVVMNEVVEAVMGDADIVCLMVSASQKSFDIEKGLFEKIGPEKCVLVVNKSDLVMRDRFDEIAARFRDVWGVREMVILSALKGDGVGHLIEVIKERLPEGPEYFPRDLYTDHSVRFLVAELIRRQLFLQLHEEIPYSTAVEIDEFKDATEEDHITRIRASIVVDKESQKGMVIGKKGERIKEIGKRSRLDIEELVDGKVFLELQVRIEKNWTKDSRKIKDLGYTDHTD